MNDISPQTPAAGQGIRDVEAAVNQLRRESRLYVLRGVCSLLCWSLAVGLLVRAVCVSAPGQGPSLLNLALCVLAILAGAATLPQARSGILEILAETRDIRAVGALLEAREIAPALRAKAIESALIALLPRLTPSEASLLNRSQRRKLYDTLALGNADRELEYMRAALKAIEQIGDEEAIAQVRHLVDRGAATQGQRRLLVAAESCLQNMEAQLEQQQHRTRLLRAASVSENPSELLQPCHPTTIVEPETLLRPLE